METMWLGIRFYFHQTVFLNSIEILNFIGTWNQNAALHSSAVYAYMNEKLPSWDFRNAQYDNDVRKRRIEELLGNFPFYDQGSKILGTYINSIDKFLRLYYENDQAVNDTLLRLLKFK